MGNLVGVIITNDKVYGFYNKTICFEQKHNVELGQYLIEDLVDLGDDDLYKVIKDARACAFSYALHLIGCKLVEEIVNKTFNRDELFELLEKLNKNPLS